jgi:hypothetical protein
VTTRADIVAALATVPGLSPSLTKTGPISAGDAWPIWTGTRYLNAVPDGLRERSWYVLVALPDAGLDVTTVEGDALIESVGMALIGAGLQIVLVEPARTQVTDTSSGVPVLRYTVHD